jgi:hypothetical protein
MNEIKVKIILPERSQDLISNDLRKLTKAICKKTRVDGSGGLGGDYGYGTRYENDTFMLHPFCWCDREDCPWCGGCNCPNSAYHYFVDGKPVTYKKYWGIFKDTGYNEMQRFKYGTPDHIKAEKEWERKLKIRDKRCTFIKDDICDFCRHEGIFRRFGDDPHNLGVPNFWYKPTNFKVRWYKWIGRSMKFNRKITKKQWEAILKQCTKTVVPNINKQGE